MSIRLFGSTIKVNKKLNLAQESGTQQNQTNSPEISQPQVKQVFKLFGKEHPLFPSPSSTSSLSPSSNPSCSSSPLPNLSPLSTSSLSSSSLSPSFFSLSSLSPFTPPPANLQTTNLEKNKSGARSEKVEQENKRREEDRKHEEAKEKAQESDEWDLGGTLREETDENHEKKRKRKRKKEKDSDVSVPPTDGNQIDTITITSSASEGEGIDPAAQVPKKRRGRPPKPNREKKKKTETPIKEKLSRKKAPAQPKKTRWMKKPKKSDEEEKREEEKSDETRESESEGESESESGSEKEKSPKKKKRRRYENLDADPAITARVFDIAEELGYLDEIKDILCIANESNRNTGPIFQDFYVQLQEHVKETGGIKNLKGKNPALRTWFSNLRNNLQRTPKAKMSQVQKARLQLLESCLGHPLQMTVYDAEWNVRLEEYKNFLRAHEQNPGKQMDRALDAWVDKQEKDCKTGKMSANRCKLWLNLTES